MCLKCSLPFHISDPYGRKRGFEASIKAKQYKRTGWANTEKTCSKCTITMHKYNIKNSCPFESRLIFSSTSKLVYLCTKVTFFFIGSKRSVPRLWNGGKQARTQDFAQEGAHLLLKGPPGYPGAPLTTTGPGNQGPSDDCRGPLGHQGPLG